MSCIINSFLCIVINLASFRKRKNGFVVNISTRSYQNVFRFTITARFHKIPDLKQLRRVVAYLALVLHAERLQDLVQTAKTARPSIQGNVGWHIECFDQSHSVTINNSERGCSKSCETTWLSDGACDNNCNTITIKLIY